MINGSQIPAFVSQKRGVIFFILFYVIASVIFFFVYHPLGMFNEDGVYPVPVDVHEYMILLLVVNIVMLVTSRVLLYLRVQKHSEWTFGNVMLWVTVEFVFVDVVVSCMGLLLGNNESVTFLRMLTRVTIDLVGLYMVPMFEVALISVLFENVIKYKRLKESYSDLETQAATLSSELVSVRAEQEKQSRQSDELREQLRVAQNADVVPEPAAGPNDEDKAFRTSMLRFENRSGDFDFALPRESVLYVETVDNYVCVNYLDQGRICNRIIRNTMKTLESQLRHEGFVRCHRQYMVNTSNVKTVSKEKDGIIIHFNGCDRVVPVGKTYASQLL